MEDHYDFERFATKICDFICTYKREVRNVPAINSNIDRNDSPFSELAKEIPEDGECFENIFNDFESKILPYLVHSNHPYNFSEFPSHSSFGTIFGEALASTFGGLIFSRESNPPIAELESLTLDWYARLLDLPTCFMFDRTNNKGGGCYHETNSEVLHNVILAARHQYIEYSKKLECTKDDWRGKIVVYASEDCCPMLKQWCQAEFIKLHVVETNHEGVMTATALERAIDLDCNIGMKPILVVATFGTFIKFAVDQIQQISELLETYKPCWLHIDATYGGNALILKRYANLKNGFDAADSIAVSPNNWLQVGFDCIAFWVKNIEKYQECFKVSSHVNLDYDPFDALDYKHYGITTKRRTKAFNMWITLRMYGKKGLEKRIRKAIELAEKFSELLEADGNIEVLQTKFTFVNFALKGADDAINEKFLESILATKKLVVIPIKLNGRFTIRFSVIYEHERQKYVVEAAKIIKDAAEKCLDI